MSDNAGVPYLLLLGESETALALDKRALKDAGFANISQLTSGIEACKKLAGLAGNPVSPDVVICEPRLADMNGDQFCAIIRQHPRLLALPILMIVPNESEAAQLKALGCGASALLGRPYSVQKLRKIIDRLLSAHDKFNALQAGADMADTADFDAALASYGILLRPSRSPQDYFRAGMRLIEENRYNIAIDAFQRALESIKIKGEAELGIAVAYRGKGDTGRYQTWLAKAAETFVKAKRWHDARTAFARLLQEQGNPRNPFLIEANRLIRLGEYETAAKVITESLPLIPSLKKGKIIANLCIGAEDTKAMVMALQEELLTHGNGEILANEIKKSLVNLSCERKEKMLKASEERQSRLVRNMDAAKNAIAMEEIPSVATNTCTHGHPIKNKIDVPLLAEASSGGCSNSPRINDFPDLPDQDDNSRKNVSGILTEGDATSELFARAPKLNEFLSIIKYTWNLARKNKK